jgi:hypothetical protein
MLWHFSYRTTIILAICLASVALHASDKAKVIASTAQVHAQASSKSNTVATLKKDEIVTLTLQLSSSEGAWCMVRAQGKSGYVKCDQLARLPRAKTAKLEPRTLYNETCGNNLGNTWRERYNLSSAQLAAAQGLAEKLGVVRCGQKAAQFQQAFHAVGVSAQTMDALKTEWLDLERRDHCGDQLQLFLAQLQTTVSPAQKELLEADRKEVHRLATTGQLPLFCTY